MADKKPNAKPTPKAVADEIVKDLAAAQRGKPGCLAAIAKKWGVEQHVVEWAAKSRGAEVMALREGIAYQGFALAAMVDERTLDALADKDRMKATTLRDFAMAREKLVNSAVTALEGHVPQVQNFNFAIIKEAKRSVEAYEERRRARLEELKSVKGAEVILP